MKTSVLLLLLIGVALAISFYVFLKPAYPMTEADAKRFFLEDLKEKYPAADVREIMEIISLTAQDGTPYYQLKARVTTGIYSPCPERIHVYYDYPPKNFVSQPPEYITRGCQICINEPNCIIAFPEEAIIASHTYPGAEKVANFIRNNADAAAELPVSLDSYNGYSGVWRVKWNSASSGGSISVIVLKSQNKVLPE